MPLEKELQALALSDRPLPTATTLVESRPQIYQDLQRIAGRLLSNEQRTPSLDTGALVHEAFLKLARQHRTEWQNRGHLFAVAARIMRRLLVDGARRRAFAKRGGGRVRLTTLGGKEIAAAAPGIDVLDLDDALVDLQKHDRQLAQLVELRFFGGSNNQEIAEIQGVTPMTVIRRWRLARAWLRLRLTELEPSQ